MDMLLERINKIVPSLKTLGNQKYFNVLYASIVIALHISKVFQLRQSFTEVFPEFRRLQVTTLATVSDFLFSICARTKATTSSEMGVTTEPISALCKAFS